MKKELEYFSIDGAVGGSQGWLKNFVMNFGGCAAVAACDVCIQLAGQMGLKELYPFDVNKLTREDYCDFTQMMKPYLRPRVMGIKKTEWFIEGFEQYLADINKKNEQKVPLILTSVSGTEKVSEAISAIKTQIDDGYPIPYLLLHHQNKERFKDFEWHWFMVIGYEETEKDFLVKVATYGSAYQFSLHELWNTGNEERGGMVLVRYKN